MKIRNLLFLGWIALGGCGSQADIDAHEEAVVVCPGASTVEGIDVSEFQGNINWSQVKASGRQFAIIRVSDGTGHLDPYFSQNWTGAKNAGLIRGVYQFFEPGGDAVAQANLLLSHMGAIGPGDLPPMIDVEVTGGQSAATITSKIHQWVDTVQKATGRKPLVYTGTWFWDPNVATSDFSSNPLVESYYCSNCCPNLPKPWSSFAIWQYSDAGAVSGISGHVDLDKFNGTLAQLQLLAGGASWSAQYVSQSWPLASAPALTMVTGSTVAASLTLRNTGSKTWDANTKLGTTEPRDRQSAFSDASWAAPHRAAHVTGTVPPGGTFKFSFNFHAPAKPGTYKEYFDLVQENVAWFSDPGQGGPPDNQIEALITVVAPNYSGQFVAQSFPAAGKPPQMLGVGESIDGWVDVKNVGTHTWKAGVTKLAPTPRDQPSPIGGAGWLSPTRVSTPAADVAPGAVGHFPVKLTGTIAGDYTQTFALVEEGVTWFADAANGGGPPDDFIRTRVVVTDAPQPPPTDDAGAVADLSGEPGEPATDDAGTGDPDPTPTPSPGGCSLAGDTTAAPAALLLLAALLLVRRRARTV